MVPDASRLPRVTPTSLVQADGRPTPEFRAELRRIPSLRNAVSVVSVYAQIGLVVYGAARFGPWSWPVAVLLMGRAFAQLLSLMHDAAHRLLFSNRTANDLVGRWLLGFPAWTSTEAYRRVHAAHHREEFGPDEPDLALYAGYPISRASLRRKLVRDATGQTGWKLMKQFLAGLESENERARRTTWQILGVQAALLSAAIASGSWWVYPVLWLVPYFTVWRVINRLRSIAEHGGMAASKDRRATTHTVRQHWLSRCFVVPFNIGLHLAHHVDSGVPFRNLPKYHRALLEAGYISDAIEYRSYRHLWRALSSRPA